ncbi:MAG: hypothetical protein ACREIC_21970, partial [Limisphaerales bacterium]
GAKDDWRNWIFNAGVDSSRRSAHLGTVRAADCRARLDAGPARCFNPGRDYAFRHSKRFCNRLESKGR